MGVWVTTLGLGKKDNLKKFKLLFLNITLNKIANIVLSFLLNLILIDLDIEKRVTFSYKQLFFGLENSQNI